MGWCSIGDRRSPQSRRGASIPGHARRLVHGQGRRDEQREQGRTRVGHELNPKPTQISSRQGRLCRYGRHRPDRLRVQQQNDRGDNCQCQLRRDPIVPEQAPRCAQRLDKSGDQRCETQRDDDPQVINTIERYVA